MQDYNFNFETRTLLTHFAAAFNDVKIKRFNGEKFEKELIKVPFVYAPKSHILADIIGVTDTIRLPIMAVEIKSQGRDNERVKAKIPDYVYKTTDGKYVNLKATPWNISVELTILAKYQEDLDQIVQNFSVNTSPYLIVSWKEPKSGREIRTEIEWDNNISYTYPGKDQKSTDFPFRVTATTNFKIKGYLFKTSIDNDTPICRIDTDYIFTDKFYCDYNALLEYTTDSQTDSYSITGRPIIRYVDPYNIVGTFDPLITVTGYGMGSVNAVFVSGTSGLYPLTEYRPFSGMPSFSAYKVDEFYRSENKLKFNLPPTSGSGLVDIIAVNPCGYGKLTEDSNRESRVENPYPVGSSEHYSWVVLQYPYLNGLVLSNVFPLSCNPNTFVNLPDDGYVFVYTQDNYQVYTDAVSAVQVPIVFANA